MVESPGAEQIRLEMYQSLVDGHTDELKKEHIEDLSSLVESTDKDIQLESTQLLATLSEENPVLLIPAFEKLVEVAKDSHKDEELKSLAASAIENMASDPAIQDIVSQMESKEDHQRSKESNGPYSLAKEARSSTVTASRLKGNERYFYNVMQFLKPEEQPHFLFALSQSWGITDGSVVVDKNGSEMTVLDRKKTGSVVITDHGVRILSEGGRWAISYGTITGTGTEKRPTPTLKIMSSGEIYRIRVAKSIHSRSEVSEAAKLINKVTKSVSGF